MDRRLNIGFAISAISAVQMDLFIAVTISLRNFFIYPFILFINSSISLIVILLYLCFSYVMGLKTYQLAEIHYKKREKQTEKINKKQSRKKKSGQSWGEEDTIQWVSVCEDVKDEVTGLGRYYHFLFFIKDLIICGSVIAFLKIPALQILACLAYNGFLLYVTLRHWPLKSTKELVVNTFGVVMEIVLVCFFGAIYLFDHQNDEKFRYENFGNGIVILILVAFAFYIVTGTIDAFINIINFVKCLKNEVFGGGKRKKDRKKNRIEAKAKVDLKN